MTGIVKNLLHDRRFGFIQGDGRRSAHFFHFDDCLDDFELRVGDRVSFDEVDPPPAKGPRALRVQLVPSVSGGNSD